MLSGWIGPRSTWASGALRCSVTVGPGPSVPRLIVPPTVMMIETSIFRPTEVLAETLGSDWLDVSA